MSAVYRFEDVSDFLDFISGTHGIDHGPGIDRCPVCNGGIRYVGIDPGWESDSFVGLRAVAVCRSCGWRHEEEVSDD